MLNLFLSEVSILGQIGYVVLGLVVGAISGFFISRKVFQNQLKKNPPITEKQIRALYMQMGRKPSEAQVRAAMKAKKNTK